MADFNRLRSVGALSEFSDSLVRMQPFPYNVSLTIKNEHNELKGGAGFN